MENISITIIGAEMLLKIIINRKLGQLINILQISRRLFMHSFILLMQSIACLRMMLNFPQDIDSKDEFHSFQKVFDSRCTVCRISFTFIILRLSCKNLKSNLQSCWAQSVPFNNNGLTSHILNVHPFSK